MHIFVLYEVGIFYNKTGKLTWTRVRKYIVQVVALCSELSHTHTRTHLKGFTPSGSLCVVSLFPDFRREAAAEMGQCLRRGNKGASRRSLQEARRRRYADVYIVAGFSCMDCKGLIHMHSAPIEILIDISPAMSL